MIRTIKSILNRSIEAPAGCGFLTSREIEAWLDGKLAGERKEAFGSHQLGGCCSCSLLAADLEVFHGVVTRGLLESERREYERTQAILKAHLRQKIESHEVKPATSSIFSWRYAGAAAAMLLLAVVSVPLLRQGGSNGPMVIGGIPVEPMVFSKPPDVRGAESLVDLWARAEKAYAAGEWSTAERLLGEISERAPEAHDAVLYRGQALLMVGRHQQAVEVLERAWQLAQEQGLLGEADNWYLGLAAQGAGKTALAREALGRVRDAGGARAGQAAERLRKLDGE